MVVVVVVKWRKVADRGVQAKAQELWRPHKGGRWNQVGEVPGGGTYRKGAVARLTLAPKCLQYFGIANTWQQWDKFVLVESSKGVKSGKRMVQLADPLDEDHMEAMM